MTETIGIIGGTLVALCTFPQTVKIFKTKKVTGVSLTFLLVAWAGSICLGTYSYLINDHIYIGINLLWFINLSISIIGYTKYYEVLSPNRNKRSS